MDYISKLKIESNVTDNTIVSYNSANDIWGLATSYNGMLGVVEGIVTEGDITYGYVCFNKFCKVALSRDLTVFQGGKLSIENGKVYISETPSEGSDTKFILPLSVDHELAETDVDGNVYIPAEALVFVSL